MTSVKPSISSERRDPPRIRPATAYVQSVAPASRESQCVIPERQAFERERDASTARWRALTLDAAWSRERVWTSSSAPYRSFRTLLDCALRTLESMGAGARYYCYHSGLGGDLVIELSRGVPLATRVTTGGRQRLFGLGGGEERVLAEDAALREVAGTMEEQGLEAALGRIEKALSAARGRVELLPVAVDLIRAKKYALAVSIIDQRLAVAPNDVNAMMLDGRVIINLVQEGHLGPELLASADARFQRVLELEPNNLRALLMWSEVPRFAGDPAGSVPRYETVLERFPGCDVAHYSLATILLAQRPDQALAHFTAGERLCPDDADYAIGRARALLAMGCIEQARLALTRARELAPEHSALPLLERYAWVGLERRIA